MTQIRAYTTIEQSKKLAEILPLATADMDYIPVVNTDNIDGEYSVIVNTWDNDHIIDEGWIPCWSLSALLSILRNVACNIDEDASVNLCSYKNVEWGLSMDYAKIGFMTNSNPIDACVEMIIHLNELKML